MLTKLHFTNFKSWPVADLEAGRITGIFGTNSSGKTSLLQFLLLLKQTKDVRDRRLALHLNGPLVELGTAKDIVYEHDERRAIEWTVSFDLKDGLKIADPSATRRGAVIAEGDTLELTAKVSVRQNALECRRLSYTLGDMTFSIEPRSATSENFDLKASRTDEEEVTFRFLRTRGRAWELPAPIKSYAFPDQARTYFQNSGFLAEIESAYEAQMDAVYYLGPLREFPKRDYLWARSRPTDVGKQGERAIDAILAATEDGEQRSLKYYGRKRPFQKAVSELLHGMGLVHTISMRELAKGSSRWEARVRTRKDAPEVLLTDVGFGVSQVLPVVTLLQYVPEGSTVVLEQPELHLHPLAQAGLADVIIQAATHRRVQVILESHSEHLLLRLQRRIAEDEEGELAGLTNLYFCDAPEGDSILTRLELDEFGNIGNWPDRFMGDAFTEAAEAEKARLRRMQAAE